MKRPGPKPRRSPSESQVREVLVRQLSRGDEARESAIRRVRLLNVAIDGRKGMGV